MGFYNDTEEATEASVGFNSNKVHPYPWITHPIILVIIVLSIIGNLFILTVVCLLKTFRKPANFQIANLCVASVYYICIFLFYNARRGEAMKFLEYSAIFCSIIGVAQRLMLPVLTFTIAAISLDRSKAAKNPLEYATNRTILGHILSIWSLSFVITLPRALINTYDPTLHGSYKCKKIPLGGSTSLQAIYAFVVLACVYLIPTYILIKEFITLRSKMRFLTLSQVEQKKRFQHRLRLMQNSCIFTIIFITCWLPQGIFQFPFDLPSEMTESFNIMKPLLTARDVSRQVVMLNTCLNPILLLLLSFDVREYLASCSLV